MASSLDELFTRAIGQIAGSAGEAARSEYGPQSPATCGAAFVTLELLSRCSMRRLLAGEVLLQLSSRRLTSLDLRG